jgi:hypothetical protein
MVWAVGSVLGVLLEIVMIIALARPGTSQYERELDAAPDAGKPEIVRVQRLPAPRQSGENQPSSVARA